MNAYLDRFMEIYERELTAAVAKYPDDYPWSTEKDGNGNPRLTVKTVVERMRPAIADGSFNKDGHAIRKTCKALGIPYTYSGIRAFIRGF